MKNRKIPIVISFLFSLKEVFFEEIGTKLRFVNNNSPLILDPEKTVSNFLCHSAVFYFNREAVDSFCNLRGFCTLIALNYDPPF